MIVGHMEMNKKCNKVANWQAMVHIKRKVKKKNYSEISSRLHKDSDIIIGHVHLYVSCII